MTAGGGRITTTHHKDHYFRKDGSEYLKDVLKYRCYHKANKLCECEGQTNYIAAKVDEAVSRIMRQVFAGMDGAPEEEKYKEILKKQQAAQKAGRRKAAMELDKNRKQLEVLQMEISRGRCVTISKVEHSAVNRVVVGSRPTRGA